MGNPPVSLPQQFQPPCGCPWSPCCHGNATSTQGSMSGPGPRCLPCTAAPVSQREGFSREVTGGCKEGTEGEEPLSSAPLVLYEEWSDPPRSGWGLGTRATEAPQTLMGSRRRAASVRLRIPLLRTMSPLWNSVPKWQRVYLRPGVDPAREWKTPSAANDSTRLTEVLQTHHAPPASTFAHAVPTPPMPFLCRPVPTH